MNKEIRKQLKGYKLTKKILDERFKGKKFKTDTGAGTFFCYDALYYGNDCISPDEYKLHELVDWIKTLLGTGANVHHPILYHISKAKAVEVIKEIIEIIKDDEKMKNTEKEKTNMEKLVEKHPELKEPVKPVKKFTKEEIAHLEKIYEKHPRLRPKNRDEQEQTVKQKATLKLADGREIKVEISEDEMKKLAVKKSPYCDLGDIHKYEKPIYYIHEFGRADEFGKTKKEYLNEIENKGSLLDILMQNANCYNDKEFAEKIARADLLMRKLRKFAIENDIDNKHTGNYSIIRFYKGKIESVFSPNRLFEKLRFFNEIIFKDPNVCQKAIETFHDELIWYFTEYLKIYE